MRNLLILIIVLANAINVTAQGQKGMIELGGQLSYTLSEYEDIYYYNLETYDYKSQRFVISPKIGWFVSSSSVLGFGIEFEYIKNERSNSIPDESKKHLFSFNPYFRNYQKIIDKLFFTTTIDLALGFGQESNEDYYTTDIFTYSINARPGISYFLSDKWALKTNFGSLFYQRTNKKITEGVEGKQPELKDSDFGFSFSMNSFSLGVGYYF
ncbi:hypothetical protein [Carboxylicivirga linearis]|uniref:Outer membrane protein beta-barrel domain-containing protein n=1 Tax=Carboxylicivirga linearis TaxID=1628157 RepID=A0ABS5K1G2_9BACT|nr:hypothetical protein [Carboxylicivirga linearis]MBS2101025.1 hypothetical protein [Carboxylicivirga linearis]